MARELIGLAIGLALALPAAADKLTPETEKILREMKLAPSLMDGLDKELAVPQAWIDGAKKEGKVAVGLQMGETEFAPVFRAFRARYPGIEYEYSRAIGPTHVRLLVAYKAGTVIADVVAAFDSRADEYHAIGMLDLRELPAYPGLRPEIRAMKGGDAADKGNYWCAMYSTERVKPADLPRTWDELLDNPRWRGGKIGVASNAGQTMLPTLQAHLGDAWANNWLTRLFGEVKPQLRKETLSAIAKLISVGEYDLGFAVQDYVIERDSKRGMAVGALCPEPVPLTWGKLGILAGTKRPNAAKLFTNWYLSREGQLASYHYAYQMPTHSALTGREFLPYPEQIVGKKVLYRDDAVLAQQPRVMEGWRKRWEAAGGAALAE
jgi:iron(III) transport system substrate-binding protein